MKASERIRVLSQVMVTDDPPVDSNAHALCPKLHESERPSAGLSQPAGLPEAPVSPGPDPVILCRAITNSDLPWTVRAAAQVGPASRQSEPTLPGQSTTPSWQCSRSCAPQAHSILR